jgi:RepB DNA-primase from phage plasmid
MNGERGFANKLLSASEYVLALHGPTHQVAVLTRHHSRRQTMQRILPAESVAHPHFQQWLSDENLAGADIFIGMNPVKEGAYRRTKGHIREIRHVYLDLDEQAEVSLLAIRNSGDVPPPTFVLDTSPGKHQVVWRVEGMAPGQAESLLHALASQFGGDPAATDIARLLRLPGFRNQKYHDPFFVRVHHETDEVYRLEDFRVRESSPESSRQPGEAEPGGRTVSPGHRSQSEADWAYAKRALSRGDRPEQIIKRIAEYRADDKADPYYYARLTVIKARLKLMSRAGVHSGKTASLERSDRDH